MVVRYLMSVGKREKETSRQESGSRVVRAYSIHSRSELNRGPRPIECCSAKWESKSKSRVHVIVAKNVDQSQLSRTRREKVRVLFSLSIPLSNRTAICTTIQKGLNHHHLTAHITLAQP